MDAYVLIYYLPFNSGDNRGKVPRSSSGKELRGLFEGFGTTFVFKIGESFAHEH